MMSSSTQISAERKLRLISAILKIEDPNVLDRLGHILLEARHEQTQSDKSFKRFAGLMSDAEADELQKIIEDGCGVASLNQ